ncbi:hypothetical protein CDD83_518 [Cordyceps sp. RAO-2017]|nr:hypothetical protein CDD83_518 [Cordyceps sp. RAO-2017]
MKISSASAALALLSAVSAQEACVEGKRVTISPGYTVEYRCGKFRQGTSHNNIASHEACAALCRDADRSVCSYNAARKICVVGDENGKEGKSPGATYMVHVEEPEEEVVEDPFEKTCEEVLDECHAREANSGNELSQCKTDLAAASSGLTQCKTDLTTASTGSAQCKTDLAAASSGLTQCKTDLTTASTGSAQCKTDLAAASSSLTKCQADLAAASKPKTCGVAKWGKNHYAVKSGMKIADCKKTCQADAKCLSYSANSGTSGSINCYLYDKVTSEVPHGTWPNFVQYDKSCP